MIIKTFLDNWKIASSFTGKYQQFIRKWSLRRATMVVAHLVEWFLVASEIYNSKSAIDKFYLLSNCIEKTKMKK